MQVGVGTWVCRWGMLDMQVGEWTAASGLEIRTEKKEKEWVIVLGFGLGQQMEVENGPSRVEIGPRLKEMGLGGAMGRMGSGCL